MITLGSSVASNPTLLLFAHSSLGYDVSILTTPPFTMRSRVCNPNFKGVEKHVHMVLSYDSTIVEVEVFLSRGLRDIKEHNGYGILEFDLSLKSRVES